MTQRAPAPFIKRNPRHRAVNDTSAASLIFYVFRKTADYDHVVGTDYYQKYKDAIKKRIFFYYTQKPPTAITVRRFGRKIINMAGSVIAINFSNNHNRCIMMNGLRAPKQAESALLEQYHSDWLLPAGITKNSIGRQAKTITRNIFLTKNLI